MFRRIEPQESFRIRHSKTNKYHKNNHYGQVHSERHQYDYHLGYSKYDDFDERVLNPNKIEAPLLTVVIILGYLICGFVIWIDSLSDINCLMIEKLDLLR
jgi:hypothetical protein